MYKRSKITKEEAQARADERWNDFIILEWDGASSPASLKCKKCGCEFELSQGGKVYGSKPPDCIKCLEAEFQNEYDEWYENTYMLEQ